MKILDISAAANPQNGIYVFAGTIEGNIGSYVRTYINGKLLSEIKHGNATAYVLNLPNSNYANGVA